MKINTRALILFCAVLASIVAFQFFIQKKQDKDVVFCRNLYAQLAKGSSAVDRLIDWNNFTMLGYNVGAQYNSLSDPKAKHQYRATAIQGFGAGFVAFKGKLSYFTNWRLYHKSDDKVIVACDYPRFKKTLLFTISKNGEDRKLTTIDWRK